MTKIMQKLVQPLAVGYNNTVVRIMHVFIHVLPERFQQCYRIRG